MEEFKCPICKHQYSEANPPRILTMCGHSFCHFCIKNMIKKKDFKYIVRCPEDRSKINIDNNTASYFPKNIALLQALRRQTSKFKQQNDHEHNQITMNTQQSHKILMTRHECKSSDPDLQQLLQSNSIFKRAGCQQGICLLHRKPLDIICLEEKIHICAECALFGMHKGHNFTTIKELTHKNEQWSYHIKEIIEQKKHIDTKILNGEIQKQVLLILKKKKDLLSEQIEAYINRFKEKIYQYQYQIKRQLQQKMENLEQQLKEVMAIHPQVESQFKEWVQKVEPKNYRIQQDSIELTTIILAEEDQRLRLEGHRMLENIKKELINFWSKIEDVLQYPKIQYSSNVEKQLSNLIKFQSSQQSSKRSQLSIDMTKIEDLTLIQQKRNQPMFDEVSLLDISARYKYEQNQPQVAVNFSQISLVDSLEINTNENIRKSQFYIEKTLNKVKSIQGTLNKSLLSSIQQKIKYKSPRQKMKTQMFSKKSICSVVPASPKLKLKRFILKTKQPQKFEKIINNLESDSVNSLDFTGFQMGDQVAKEICIKILECKKPKLLRLMKNCLTDDSAKQVVESLKVIDYLNLAQNNFTQKILYLILDLSKKGEIGKNKTIQLGQNRLNSRKYKSKMDQLKKLGVIITL